MAASTQKSAKPAKAKVEATPKPSKAAAKSVKKVQPAASKAAPKAEAPVAKKALTPAAHLAARAAAAPQRSMTVPAGAHKPASQKLTTPVAAAAQPASPKAIAEKAVAARQMLAVQKKPVSQRHGFKANEFIVYPAHGVGRIVGIEEQEIAGMSLELFVITFDKEKLTLRVPTGKLASVGMRKLADESLVKKAMETLKGRARIKRTMWSRRAQEYVAKINSGDLISIAEVVRDLYRSEAQPEQSYSERQLYEDALDRMARELAAVEKLDERGAVQRITDILSKSAKGRRLAENESSVGEAA
jgi:CarD family transcriptional regulator